MRDPTNRGVSLAPWLRSPTFSGIVRVEVSAKGCSAFSSYAGGNEMSLLNNIAGAQVKKTAIIKTAIQHFSIQKRPDRSMSSAEFFTNYVSLATADRSISVIFGYLISQKAELNLANVPYHPKRSNTFWCTPIYCDSSNNKKYCLE